MESLGPLRLQRCGKPCSRFASCGSAKGHPRERKFSISAWSSCRHPRLSWPRRVPQLRPGRRKLALEHLDASATTPKLAPFSSTADPGGRGADHKTREQQQQDEKVERQVDEKRQRP